MNLTKDQFFDKAYLVAYLFVAATVPLNLIHLNSVAIMLLGLVWLLEPNWNLKLSNFLKNIHISGAIIAFFLFHIISLAYTDNIKTGFFEIEKKLSFIFFPLIIFSTSYRIPLKWIQLIFVTCLSMIMIWDIYDVILNPEVMQHYQLIKGGDFRLALAEYHGIHPTYRSLQIVGGMAFTISLWRSISSKITKIWLVLSFAIFLIFLLLMASRIVLGSILISCLLYVLILSPKKIRLRLGMILLAGLILLGTLVWLLPSSKVRFDELVNTSFTPPTGGVHNSISLRAAHLHCDIELAKQNYWIGVGIGDVQNMMNNCYRSNHFSDFLYSANEHNCHNQYFQSLIGMGLLGLLSLLLMYILPVVILKHKIHFAYYFVLFSFAMAGLTETVFGIQKGIVFFTFFYCLLAQNNISNSHSENQ